MVLDIVRRLNPFTGRSGPPHAGGFGFGGEEAIDYDEILARLQLTKTEVDSMRNMVLSEIRSFYDKMIAAARKKDIDSLHIHAAEIVLKKRILKALTMYSRLIELAIIRIQDARNIESLARALAPLEFAMRAMDEYLAATSPEIAARLSSIVQTTERVVKSTSITVSNIPIPTAQLELDPEVKREIARVLADVSREVDDLVPDPERVVSPKPREEELDTRVYEHIKRSGGVVKIGRLAEELGVERDEIVRSLRRLQRKGLIRIASRGGEASTLSS
ncbi:MAG: MarR family transcriptional regulator [Aeropyrum sp.]|nr:MarR family transcriptional regulator [Aeropyrum sp.]